MNPDLQNKIDEDYIHGKNMVDEYGLSHEAIKSAKRTCWGSNTEMQVFAIGCEHGMQIERIKLQKELTTATEKYDHARIELRSYDQILDEKNKEIQSLKDENKKFREALEFYANGGNPNRDIWFDEKLGYFTGKRARQTLEGVSK